MDYELDGDKVIDFKMVVTDWTTGIVGGERYFFGGTPVYAGPSTFSRYSKDLFTFGRIAMELFVEKTGNRIETKSEQY